MKQGHAWLATGSQSRKIILYIYIYIYLVGGLEHCLFFHILGAIIPTD